MKKQLYPGWPALLLALFMWSGGQICFAQQALAFVKQQPKSAQPVPASSQKMMSLSTALKAIKENYHVDIIFGDQNRRRLHSSGGANGL